MTARRPTPPPAVERCALCGRFTGSRFAGCSTTKTGRADRRVWCERCAVALDLERGGGSDDAPLDLDEPDGGREESEGRP